MSFYGYSKEERKKIIARINDEIIADIGSNSTKHFIGYFDDPDTYMRKSAYVAVGNIVDFNPEVLNKVLEMLEELSTHDSYRIRQTVINAAGEIGKKNFAAVEAFFDRGLRDNHHSPRNAVIGSIKKMGEVNPLPVLLWAKKHLHDNNKEVRRMICHGIELRGRTHPEDILPLLEQLQHDDTTRVRKTLVHVLGQISYKKGCLEQVIAALRTWENKQLVNAALTEIVDVHKRYRAFAAATPAEAKKFIEQKINISLR
jgi:HEAT repeat protein